MAEDPPPAIARDKLILGNACCWLVWIMVWAREDKLSPSSDELECWLIVMCRCINGKRFLRDVKRMERLDELGRIAKNNVVSRCTETLQERDVCTSQKVNTPKRQRWDDKEEQKCRCLQESIVFIPCSTWHPSLTLDWGSSLCNLSFGVTLITWRNGMPECKMQVKSEDWDKE